MLNDDLPIFNLRAVVQETGVKPDTLRAWERRYGLPNPDRGGGGHRLYSRRDIDTVKWLLARRAAGLSISKAVDLWRQLDIDGENKAQATQKGQWPGQTPFQGVSPNGTTARMCQSWISACLAFDERGARQVLAESFALFSVEHVCLEVLQTGLAQIGQGWYEGDVTVQQEHFATGMATRQLESLLSATPAPTRVGRILAVCPPQENHVFGLLLLALLLRRNGWDVVYLGANVPIDHIAETVGYGSFQLVVSAAQQLYTAASLMEMAMALQQVGVSFAYGGRIFNLLPLLRTRIPGHFLGESLQAAPQAVESLLVTRPPQEPIVGTSVAFTQTHDHYQQRLPAIEATVEEMLSDSGIAHAQIAQANPSMGMDISAALVLGDMAYLGTEISWVEGLLHNRAFPAELVDRYLLAYREAVRANMGECGRPILTWLEAVV